LGPALLVLAISEDRSGESVVAPFLAKLKLGHVAVYLDPKNGAIKAFGAQGLPTSFLITRDGRVRAMLEGSTDWDSPAMIARLRPYLETPPALEKTSLTR
ncbi:MAG: TlpA disulfide reductase family protein, partial [Stellaceae bacterium]